MIMGVIYHCFCREKNERIKNVITVVYIKLQLYLFAFGSLEDSISRFISCSSRKSVNGEIIHLIIKLIDILVVGICIVNRLFG